LQNQPGSGNNRRHLYGIEPHLGPSLSMNEAPRGPLDAAPVL
jgi:hypothetical protein